MKVTAVIPVTLASAGADKELDDGASLALTELAGKPLLGHVCDRLARVARLESLIVVTTAASADDPIEAFCHGWGVACFRSPRGDELGRVLDALKSIEAKAGAIVRTNAPLIDPSIVDHVVDLVEMTDGMLDYIGTDLAQTYPRGMEVEAFTRAALEDADHRCEAQERSSATLYLRRNSRLYRLLGVKAPDDLQRPALRLDIRGAADLARLEPLLRHFAGRGDFSLGEIIAFLDAHADDVSPK